ncbi:M48 family metalloprotease [Polymorphospora rubra]|uniref:Peptidase M48 domain-containing protein n=1 Tax=Polymorphospora rubra TaxID=338584 RepID=A0A810MUH4_9ACTN|nr:M48 family metalloprotease [Polymorphospora rubra]BCJ63679.1 hypothetical protein Prubr_07000 [Polymorphospora rubra]
MRFGLLIGAVLATGLLVLFTVELHLPGRVQTFQARLDECDAAFDAGVARLVAQRADQDPERRRAVQAELRRCLRPTLTAQLAFTGCALAVLAGATGVGYAAHPWWLIRRRRLARLSAATTPRLVADLDRLRRQAGLTRAPRWWVAPHRRTMGGQAFGLPGRRCVQLDAGLLLLRVTDPAAFRAVVLHELAHLRNRDVDMTYLTIAVWWAFLGVVVLPRVVLLMHPYLLIDPTGWTWRSATPVAAPVGALLVLGSLLALTCLVYLIRNSVLRERETHADAVAAAVDGPDSALPGVLARLPKPRSPLGRWGTHPAPRDRLRAVRDPSLPLVPRHWELVSAGLPAGVVTANLVLLAGIRIGLDPRLGVALLALLTGPWLAGLLALTVWRSAVADVLAGRPGRRVPLWLSGAPVLVGSYLAGMFLSAETLTSGLSLPGGGRAGSWLVAAVLLVVGVVLLGAWVDSTARAVLAAPRVPRRALPAVVATAAVVGGAALAVWLPASMVSSGFDLAGGAVPAPGGEIGWYATVAAWTAPSLGPAVEFVYNPLTLPASTVLWAVPALLLVRAGGLRTVRRAGVVGLLGGAAAAVSGAVLPVVGRLVLPADVRRVEADAGPSYAVVLDNSVVAVGSVAVAVVIAVVVLGRGPLRPASALLAGTVAMTVSLAAFYLVAGPVQCLTSVREAPSPWCFPVPSSAAVSQTAHWILVQGVILAVPLVLAAAVPALRRYRRADSPPVPALREPRGTVAAVVVLLVVAAWLTWAVLPAAYDMWLRPTFG